MSRRTSASVLTRWLAVATAVGLLAGCGKKEEPQDTSATGTTAESPATTGAAPDTSTGAAGAGGATGGDMGAGGTGAGGAAGGDMGAGGTGAGGATGGAGGATGADMTGTTGGAAGGTGAGAAGGTTGGATGGTGAGAGGTTGGAAGAATGTGAGASAGGATQTASAGGGDAEALMKSSDCLSCHAVDTKLVGPAYGWVAHKYKGQSGAADKLAQKIKQGGAGNWNALTGGVPMPPHPQLSDADAKAMAEWVLKQKPIAPPKA